MIRLGLLALAGSLAAAELPIRLPDPLCCTTDYERRLLITVAEPGLEVRLDPPAVASASLRSATGGWELRLQAAGESTGMLELVGRDRQIRARTRIQPVAIRSDCEKRINTEGKAADGAVIFYGTLFLKPHVPGLDIRFACLGRDMRLPDGLSERWIASETFTPDPGSGASATAFRFLREPQGRWVPFAYVLYQGGEQISVP
jgi:hypothetical protein